MSSSSSSPKKYALVERTIGGKVLSLETGRWPSRRKAVVARLGDTMALVAMVSDVPREGIDFFPLSVEYREKTYSAGKFPGGFIKREGRPSTKEILTSRLIDRPLRPLFPSHFRDEIQIQASPISADRKNDPDILSIIGASASLVVAENIPFLGPVGAVRVGRIDGRLVALPTVEELGKSDLDLIVASTEQAVVMIEGFGSELPEPEMLEAIMHAHRLNLEIIAPPARASCRDRPAASGSFRGPARSVALPTARAVRADLHEAKRKVLKQERNEAVKALEVADRR